jgi:DNA-binding transcriptional regulator YiaG
MKKQKKQNETGPLEFQERLKKMQDQMTSIMSPKDQQSRFQAVSNCGRTALVLGSSYFGTEFGESKEKALEIVMKVGPRFAADMTNFMEHFDDVVVQTSYQKPDNSMLAPPAAGLFFTLSDSEAKVQTKVRALSKALNLNAAEMALVMGVSVRTVYNWLEDNVKKPNKIKNIMALGVIALHSQMIDTAPQGEQA